MATRAPSVNEGARGRKRPQAGWDAMLQGIRAAAGEPLVVVCAPDSFKGSLSARKAAEAMARGIANAMGKHHVETRVVPLADGGEGTVEAMVRATGGQFRECKVLGPLGEPRRAQWGVIDAGRTAVIEMAEAAGLTLVRPPRRNPMHTTTFGVGQLLRAALEDPKVERILIGVGGSATCDGGIGMAQALGALFLDEHGHPLPGRGTGAPPPRGPTGKTTGKGSRSSSARLAPVTGSDLPRIARLDLTRLDSRLRGREILVACDVENPLAGPRGAAAIYGPQKGASPKDVRVLDRGLRNLAALWKTHGLGDVAARPGAGAAGGLAAGLVTFCGARLVPGIEVILDAVAFEGKLRGADLVLTGEGALNEQSLAGKVVSGVARRSRAAGVPVVVLAGSVAQAPPMKDLLALGIVGVFAIADGPLTAAEAMRGAAKLIEKRAGWIPSLLLAGRGPRGGTPHSTRESIE